MAPCHGKLSLASLFKMPTNRWKYLRYQRLSRKHCGYIIKCLMTVIYSFLMWTYLLCSNCNYYFFFKRPQAFLFCPLLPTQAWVNLPPTQTCISSSSLQRRHCAREPIWVRRRKKKERSLQLSASNNCEWESVCETERERARGGRITRRGRSRHLFHKMFNVFWQVSYVRCWESGCARQHSSGLTSAALPEVEKEDRRIYSTEEEKLEIHIWDSFSYINPRGDAAASTVHSFTLF